MDLQLNHVLHTLVLQYTSFVDGFTDVPWLTSINKFELDIKRLLEDGYVSLSIEEAIAYRQSSMEYPKKSFCIGFFGGYLDNYTLAFPVICKYKIKVSIFVETHVFNEEASNRISNEIAQTMVDSGLVNIYPLWSERDFSEKFESKIQQKIHYINDNVKNNDASKVVAFNSKELAQYPSSYLKAIGFRACVFYRYDITPKDVENGVLISFRVDFEFDSVDIINTVKTICARNFKNDECYEKSAIYYEPDKKALEKTIILPIDPNPMVKNYMRHAVPLSVLQAYSREKAELFVLTDCIEVSFSPWDFWFDYHNFSYEHWSSIEYRKITRDIITANKINIIEYIINGLKIGYYSDIWLDTYYIPNKPSYFKEHKTHGILIYGYDSEIQMFYAISYTSNGHYESFKVSPMDVSLGCTNHFFMYLNLIRANEVDISAYDLQKIYYKLKDYINSICVDNNACFTRKSKVQFYNYNACIKLAEMLSHIATTFKCIPISMIYSYIEHKQLMIWRLMTIDNRESLHVMDPTQAEKIQAEVKKLLNSCIKFNFKNSNYLLKQIIDLMERINNNERYFVELLLKAIKKKYNFEN